MQDFFTSKIMALYKKKKEAKKHLEKLKAWTKYAEGELAKGEQPTEYKDYTVGDDAYFKGIKSKSTQQLDTLGKADRESINKFFKKK